MIEPKLLAILRCPIDRSSLKLAEESVVQRINDGISRGQVRDRLDQKIDAPIDGGLVNEASTRLYPIRDGIPSLVADEAIAL